MNKRIKFGRRKSDWLIPLGFLAVGVIAAFWASYNRTRKSDLERQKEALELQIKNLERIVENYEKGQPSDKVFAGGKGQTKVNGTPAPASVTVGTARVGDKTRSGVNASSVNASGVNASGVNATPTVTSGLTQARSTPGSGNGTVSTGKTTTGR